MKSCTIMAIETSCDETSVAVLRYNKAENEKAHFTTLSHITLSQATMHAQYGGVYPTMAKREHEANIVSIIAEALDKAGLLCPATDSPQSIHLSFLEKEEVLRPSLTDFVQSHMSPQIDAIAVTTGPGLEPTLWVGINCARSLADYWNIPVIPVNHMEGHLLSVMAQPESFDFEDFPIPSLALLISGGHTEFISVNSIGNYSKIGQTRDDAVGEAFDKVARLLGLSYPGGPEISRLSKTFEKLQNVESNQIADTISLPRPMIHSKDLDFSFSGIKTSARYLVESLPKPLSEQTKMHIAYEFETAVTEVLTKKTRDALMQTNAQSLIVAGGVSANSRIQSALQSLVEELSIPIYLPNQSVSGDNALMIAIAGILTYISPTYTQIELSEIRANANWSL